MGMKYCGNCKQLVTPTKKFSWAVFLLGLLTLGIISVIYIIYYLAFKKRVCPMCESTNWTVPPKESS